MANKLRINRETLRELKRAQEAAEHIETAALSDSCRNAVRPYIDLWILAPLTRAIDLIEGNEPKGGAS